MLAEPNWSWSLNPGYRASSFRSALRRSFPRSFPRAGYGTWKRLAYIAATKAKRGGHWCFLSASTTIAIASRPGWTAQLKLPCRNRSSSQLRSGGAGWCRARVNDRLRSTRLHNCPWRFCGSAAPHCSSDGALLRSSIIPGSCTAHCPCPAPPPFGKLTRPFVIHFHPRPTSSYKSRPTRARRLSTQLAAVFASTLSFTVSFFAPTGRSPDLVNPRSLVCRWSAPGFHPSTTARQSTPRQWLVGRPRSACVFPSPVCKLRKRSSPD